MAGIISTNFIKGAGLKKCKPINRSGILTDAARDVMDREEVLDARMQSFETILLNSVKTFFLMSIFSIIASMIRSQDLNWLKSST